MIFIPQPLRLWGIVITRGRREGGRVDFTPQPLRLWGIVITRGGQTVGRAVRNSALTKKLTYEFCLFFTDMTYVPGQFIRYIFFGTKP